MSVMKLDDEDIEEFKKIYREEFGEELSDAQAERRGRAQVIGHALDWVIVREPASARAREAASQPD